MTILAQTFTKNNPQNGVHCIADYTTSRDFAGFHNNKRVTSIYHSHADAHTAYTEWLRGEDNEAGFWKNSHIPVLTPNGFAEVV